MATYFLKRLGLSVITLFLLSLVVFYAGQVLPGNPGRFILGPLAAQSAVAALDHSLGVDRPLVDQYWTWISHFVRGNMGTSYQFQSPVEPFITSAAVQSIKLAGVAFVLVVPLSILGGVLAAKNVVPESLGTFRTDTIEALDSDYARTATLKGLRRSVVIRRHVLRNSLLPTITVIATQMGYLIGGLLVVETLFNYQGIGTLVFKAVNGKDFPMLEAGVLSIGIVYMLATLLADIAYSLLNPRIRLGGAE